MGKVQNREGSPSWYRPLHIAKNLPWNGQLPFQGRYQPLESIEQAQSVHQYYQDEVKMNPDDLVAGSHLIRAAGLEVTPTQNKAKHRNAVR